MLASAGLISEYVLVLRSARFVSSFLFFQLNFLNRLLYFSHILEAFYLINKNNTHQINFHTLNKLHDVEDSHPGFLARRFSFYRFYQSQMSYEAAVTISS